MMSSNKKIHSTLFAKVKNYDQQGSATIMVSSLPSKNMTINANINMDMNMNNNNDIEQVMQQLSLLSPQQSLFADNKEQQNQFLSQFSYPQLKDNQQRHMEEKTQQYPYINQQYVVPPIRQIQQYNRNILCNLYNQSKTNSNFNSNSYCKPNYLCPLHSGKFQFVCMDCRKLMCRLCYCTNQQQPNNTTYIPNLNNIHNIHNIQSMHMNGKQEDSSLQIGKYNQIPKYHKILSIQKFLQIIKQETKNKATKKHYQCQVRKRKQSKEKRVKQLSKKAKILKNKNTLCLEQLKLITFQYQQIYNHFVKQVQNYCEKVVQEYQSKIRETQIIDFVTLGNFQHSIKQNSNSICDFRVHQNSNSQHNMAKPQNQIIQCLSQNWHPIFTTLINNLSTNAKANKNKGKYKVNLKIRQTNINTNRRNTICTQEHDQHRNKSMIKNNYSNNIKDNGNQKEKEKEKQRNRIMQDIQQCLDIIQLQLQKINQLFNNCYNLQLNKPNNMTKSDILNQNTTTIKKQPQNQPYLRKACLTSRGSLMQQLLPKSKSRQKITQKYTLTQIKNNIKRQSLSSLSIRSSITNSINRKIKNIQNKHIKIKKIIKNQVEKVTMYGGNQFCSLTQIYYPWKIGTSDFGNKSLTFASPNHNSKKQFPPHKGFGFLKLQKQRQLIKPIKKQQKLSKDKLSQKYSFIIIGGYLNGQINQCIFRVNCQRKKKEFIGRMNQPLAFFGFTSKPVKKLTGIRLYALYICGGSNSFNQAVSDLTYYQFSQNAQLINKSSLSSLDQPRHSLTLTEHKSYLYAIGGMDNQNRVLKTVTRYCPKSQNWIHCPDLCYQRSNHAAVSLDSGLYVIGGWNGQNYLRSVQKYDEIRQKFQIIMDMKQARASFGIMPCPQTDAIIILGGNNKQQLSSCQYLSIKNKSTCFLKSLKSSKSDFYCF